MPVTTSYPGLYIEELPSSAHPITPAPTSITVFVGYTHPFNGLYAEKNKDPNHKWGDAVQIFSYTDYERWFGGMYRSFVPSDVSDAVNQFFLNGGSNAYVVPLRPRFHPAGGAASLITPLTTDVNGISFTAKHLTDAKHVVSITIRNVQGASADLVITFGSRLEQYKNVKLVSAGPADADLMIDKQLARSSIVSVAPTAGGTTFPNTWGVVPTTAIELGDMNPPGPIFDPQDFLDVFEHDKPLDKVEIFNLLTVPGIAHNGIWSTVLSYCERRQAFCILDAPKNASADDTAPAGFTKIQDLVNSFPHASPNGALYFPWLNTFDPITNGSRAEPPSGYVAGIFAKTDLRRGVWKAPAGLETSLLNTTGVVETGRMTDMRQGTVNDLGVNVLRSFPNQGTVVWGARTIGTNLALAQWKYIPVRRTALFIEQTLLRNLGWVVFEPNDEPLWTAIRISIENFMFSLFRQQAFQGSTPSEAFLVKCDKTTTTQEDIENGRVNIVVGFRPLKPAEFVIIKIAQLAGQAP